MASSAVSQSLIAAPQVHLVAASADHALVVAPEDQDRTQAARGPSIPHAPRRAALPLVALPAHRADGLDSDNAPDSAGHARAADLADHVPEAPAA